MNDSSPFLLKVTLDDTGFLPSAANEIVSELGLIGKRCKDFRSGLTFVKRCNQRLNNGQGPVKRASVAPLFKTVRDRNVPITSLSRLVVIQTQSYLVLCLRDNIGNL